MSLYHDVSTAPLLGLRRRFRLVANLLSAMIRDGVSLARSVELAVQWDGVLPVGPIPPIIAEDFLLARGEDLSWTVLSGGAGSSLQAFDSWLEKIHLFILTSGSGLSWSLLLLFCSVILLLLRGFWGAG